jgi:hypothetical protein
MKHFALAKQSPHVARVKETGPPAFAGSPGNQPQAKNVDNYLQAVGAMEPFSATGDEVGLSILLL